MRFSTALVSAFALGSTAAGLDCTAHPKVNSLLSACSTVTPFCESLLATSTVTATIPKSTFTYKLVSTSTILSTVHVPTSTSVVTTCVAKSSQEKFKNNLLATASTSCGVAGYAPSAVSEGCSCIVGTVTPTTTFTKTVKYSTTLKITSSTATTSVTSTKYSHTVVVTSTLVNDLCYPPANASCQTPGSCDLGYTIYVCGDNGEEDCLCGLDSNNLATCFENVECTSQTCVDDYDCGEGEGCLYDSCCDVPICAAYDVCEGDTTATGTIPAATPAVSKPKSGTGLMSNGKMSKRFMDEF